MKTVSSAPSSTMLSRVSRPHEFYDAEVALWYGNPSARTCARAHTHKDKTHKRGEGATSILFFWMGTVGRVGLKGKGERDRKQVTECENPLEGELIWAGKEG